MKKMLNAFLIGLIFSSKIFSFEFKEFISKGSSEIKKIVAYAQSLRNNKKGHLIKTAYVTLDFTLLNKNDFTFGEVPEMIQELNHLPLESHDFSKSLGVYELRFKKKVSVAELQRLKNLEEKIEAIETTTNLNQMIFDRLQKKSDIQRQFKTN